MIKDGKKSSISVLKVRFYLLFLRASRSLPLLLLLSFSLLVVSVIQKQGELPPSHPPPHLIFRGAHSSYAKVPAEFRKTYFIREDTYDNVKEPPLRALNELGWRRSNDMRNANLIWSYHKTGIRNWFEDELHILKPYQRHNHLPGSVFWESKWEFFRGIEKYRRQNPEVALHMIPETYILNTYEGIRDWRQRLFENGGINEPWIRKAVIVNGGKGIKVLGPNSLELKSTENMLDYQKEGDPVYLVQAYICNELTWWGNRKFDLRFYWMVVSLDPLIVLFHDGFARVGSSKYNEKDFSSTEKHLTTYTGHPDEFKAPSEDIEALIRDHYKQNKHELRQHIKIDPWEHVRNQLKESIAVTIDAFKDKTFGFQDELFSADNGFGLFGCDFVIDKNLHAYFLEPQLGPGLEESTKFRVSLNRDMFVSGFRMVEEIQKKLEINPTKNVLPLDNQGNWDIVYAESGDNSWMYRYEGFTAPKKSSCF